MARDYGYSRNVVRENVRQKGTDNIITRFPQMMPEYFNSR